MPAENKRRVCSGPSCTCADHGIPVVPSFTDHEDTADGPVPRHKGEWLKIADTWYVVVSKAGNPKSGDFVRVRRRDGTTQDKLLVTRVSQGWTRTIFTVKDYDSRYSDLDPEPYSW